MLWFIAASDYQQVVGGVPSFVILKREEFLISPAKVTLPEGLYLEIVPRLIRYEPRLFALTRGQVVILRGCDFFASLPKRGCPTRRLP